MPLWLWGAIGSSGPVRARRSWTVEKHLQRGLQLQELGALLGALPLHFLQRTAEASHLIAQPQQLLSQRRPLFPPSRQCVNNVLLCPARGRCYHQDDAALPPPLCRSTKALQALGRRNERLSRGCGRATTVCSPVDLSYASDHTRSGRSCTALGRRAGDNTCSR